MEHLAARHDHFEPRTRAEEPADIRRGSDDVLEVVEQEEHLLVGDVGGEPVLGAELPRGRFENEVRVLKRGERNPEDAVRVSIGKGGGCLGGETRLSRAPRPGEREQTDVVTGEQRARLAELPLSTEKRCRWDRQVRLVERLERREVASPSW